MPSVCAICSEMNGSCAITSMPKARARAATSWPMRPRPMTPSVLPRSSAPVSRFLSQTPRFIAASAAGTARASASISASACSATLTLLAPGEFMTTMPRAVAAATSTLSTPVPARAITRSLDASAITDASTVVALRTISASASARSRASSACRSSGCVRRRSIRERCEEFRWRTLASWSAMTMCMAVSIMLRF